MLRQTVSVFCSRQLLSRATSSRFTANSCSLLSFPGPGTSSLRREQFRFITSTTAPVEPFKPTEEGEKKRDKQKVRRAYALGGCLMVMWFSTHAILLFRRNSEHHTLNEKLPPMPFEEFVVKYIASGQIKTIVYQPSYDVANVYLHNAEEAQMKKTSLQLFRAAPEKFTRPPDVRFSFEGDAEGLEKSLKAAQKAFTEEGKEAPGFEFELDQFPSYRELSFIIASTIFTLAAMSLVK